MELSKLLKCLPPDAYEIHFNCSPAIDIRSIKILTGFEKDYKSDTLYFSFGDSLPVLNTAEIAGSFFLSETDPQNLNFSDVLKTNVFILQKEHDPEHVFNLIHEALEAEISIEATINQMTQAYFNCVSMRHLLTIGYEVFENPIIVELPSRRRLAQYLGDGPFAKDDALIRYLQDEASMDYMMDDESTFFEKTHLIDQLLETNRPILSHHDRADTQMMSCIVRVVGVLAAVVHVLEHNRPFRATDPRLLSHFSLLIGQEIQKESVHTKNPGSSLSFLLIDMLRNEHLDEETALYELHRVKFPLLGKNQIAVLHSNDFPCPNQVVNYLQDITSGHMRAMYEDDLVIMFNLRPDEELSDHVLSELGQLAENNNMSVGLSNDFHNIVHLRSFYQQALNAAIMGDSILDQPLVEYRYVACLDMINTCRQSRNLLDFVDTALFRMIQESEDDQSHLAETLYQYLVNYGKTAQTAKALHVHKNTLLYRLGKLRTILGSQLDNGEDMFRYYMTFKILASLRMFPADIFKVRWSDPSMATQEESTTSG